MTSVSLYSLRLVKDKSYRVVLCDCANAGAPILRRLIGDRPNEHFAALFLSGHNQVIGSHIIGIGGLHGVDICPRDVFRAAIVANASGVILGHNHPSGDPTPSIQDINTTRKLIEAGKMIGMPVLDHIVVAMDRHVSMFESGCVEF